MEAVAITLGDNDFERTLRGAIEAFRYEPPMPLDGEVDSEFRERMRRIIVAAMCGAYPLWQNREVTSTPESLQRYFDERLEIFLSKDEVQEFMNSDRFFQNSELVIMYIPEYIHEESYMMVV